MTSYNTPMKGTVEYLRHVVENESDIPRNWISWGSGQTALVDVDSSTKETINRLIQSTWNSSRVKGDLKESKNFLIRRVRRIENPDFFKSYRAARRELLLERIRLGSVCPRVGDLPNSSGGVETRKYLSKVLTDELCQELNEFYLLHGTTHRDIDWLKNIWIKKSAGGVLGSGIYQAEKSTKAILQFAGKL